MKKYISILVADGSVCIFTDDYEAKAPYVVGTQAQLNSMLSQGLLADGTVCVVTDDYSEVLNLASNIGYDNTSSGLSSTRVQGAIDEVENSLITYESHRPLSCVALSGSRLVVHQRLHRKPCIEGSAEGTYHQAH